MALEPKETLDVALLPLEDGRQLMVPLEVLAEVQLLENRQELANGDLGILNWRGLELSIESLDAICGLPAPSTEQLFAVGVFKAGKNSNRPFRALAFTGTAANARIDASKIESRDPPADGYFIGATEMQEQVYLIPDLHRLLYA